MIPVIRKYSPNAVILMGTPKYCSTLIEATENPLDYQNIMYTYHFYVGLSDCKHAIERITEAVDNGLPVFISEWSLKDSQGRDDTVKFLNFLNEKKISWINWSLCNKDEGYSMIDPDMNTLGGWGENDLTESGRLVLQYLRKTDTNDTK